MSVDYLLLFAVCQAAYVQPDGITLPITSLSYKSLPTDPKEVSLSFPNTENIETSSDVKLVEPVASPKTFSKYVFSGNYNQRPIGPFSILPQSNFPKQAGKPISIQNLSLNTATPQVTTLPVINLPNKLENNILNNYAPKIPPIVGTTPNAINNRNDNTANLKYNLPVGANTAPFNTCRVSNINTPAIYSTFDTRNLEETSLIPERDSTMVKNVPTKINDAYFVPDALVNSLQQNIDFTRISKAPSVEKPKMLGTEIPIAINREMCPINNIMFGGPRFPISPPSINTLNAPPVSRKINITPNTTTADNKVDLTVTPSVKIDNSKIKTSPCQITKSEFENISDINTVKPNIEPVNYVQPPVPTLTTYFYVPREVPKVYQLPTVCTDAKITPLYPPYSFAPPSSVCKETDTYNYVRRENIVNTPVEFSNSGFKNTMPKTLVYAEPINYSPSVPNYYASPTHTTEIPTLPQPSNVYTSPKITYPSVSQFTDTNPSNIIYINMADMSSPKPIDSRVPICNLNTEAQLQRPIPPVAATTATPFYKPLDSKSMQSLNYIPVSNNIIYYPPENTKPAFATLESQYSCPSNPIFPASYDLLGSSITDSLNSIISSFTTGLLSAFYDTSAQKENIIPMLPDSDITGTSSSSLSMPMFSLNPPELESPTTLPEPKVDLTLSKHKLSSKKKSKKPKPYISTITINLLPPKEATNDIIVML